MLLVLKNPFFQSTNDFISLLSKIRLYVFVVRFYSSLSVPESILNSQFADRLCLVCRISLLTDQGQRQVPRNPARQTLRKSHRHTFRHRHRLRHRQLHKFLLDLLKSHFVHGSGGWRRLIGCLKSQVIFRKRATNYRAIFAENDL